MYHYIYPDFLLIYNCTTQSFIRILNDIMDCEKQTGSDLNQMFLKSDLFIFKNNHNVTLCVCVCVCECE